MAKRLHGQVWRHALILFRDGALGDVSDEQLVEQFVNGQGEDGEGAFEVLLERHGPMVFRICRTILRNRHDAEDAFQATFLVLARRARSIRHPASLASWLHGVARRVACHARSAECRRRQHEQRVAGLADPCMIEPLLDDLTEVVHAEIDSLPERYRAAVVLCDIEGLTEGQAARRLGRPVGTIRSQLSRGRQQLRRRLIHRGLAPAVALFALTRAAMAEERIVPSALVQRDGRLCPQVRSNANRDGRGGRLGGWCTCRRVSQETDHGPDPAYRNRGTRGDRNRDGRCIRA